MTLNDLKSPKLELLVTFAIFRCGTYCKWLAAWRSGDALNHINEVTLRRDRLVLGWVIVHGTKPTVGRLSLLPSMGW